MIRCGNSSCRLYFSRDPRVTWSERLKNGVESESMGPTMVRTCSVLNVPKIQYVIGPDHGAANYGMCGRAFKPVFCYTNMRGRTTVMSGRQQDSF